MIIICCRNKLNVFDILELKAFCLYLDDKKLEYKCLFSIKQNNISDFFKCWDYDINYRLSENDYIIFYKQYVELLGYKDQKFSILNYNQNSIKNIKYNKNCQFIITQKKIIDKEQFPFIYIDNTKISPLIKLSYDDIKNIFGITSLRKQNEIRITKQYFPHAEAKMINFWGNIKDVITDILSCEHIYTDNYYGLCLAISLNKKVTLVNEIEQEEYSILNTINNNLKIKYSNDKISIDLSEYKKCIDFYSNIISSINKKELIDLDKIDLVSLENVDELYIQYRYLIDKIKYGFIYNKKEKNHIDNLSIIQCFFGDSNLQILASKKAIECNIKNSNYITDDWIFIECSSEKHFSYLTDYGIKYFYIKLEENSKDIFLKEYLWNIGAEKSKYENLCFIDSDFYYCDCDWMFKTKIAFESYDIFQNYTIALRENVINNDITIKYCVCKRKLDGMTGYNICIKKNIFLEFNRFCFSRTADTYFYDKILQKKEEAFNAIEFSNNQNIDIRTYPLYIGYIENQYGYHVRHSNELIHEPHYSAYKHIFYRTCNKLHEELDLKEFPKWKESLDSQIVKNLILESRVLNQNDEDYEFKLESIIQNEKLKYYGEIYKLFVVTTCLKTDDTSVRRIQKLKKLYSEFLDNKHEFICLTNTKIPEINCIPFKNNYFKDSDYSVEIFRNDYRDIKMPVLYIDNYTFPIRHFKIPNFNDNKTLFMNRVAYSRTLQYSSSCMLFSGDHSHIYDNFVYKKYHEYINLRDIILYSSLINNNKIDSIQKLISLYPYSHLEYKIDHNINSYISLIWNAVNIKMNTNKNQILNYMKTVKL